MVEMSPATPSISVIVATRNRRESLQRFVEKLHRLSDPPPWELIIVDNGSSDGTQAWLASAIASLPGVIINERQPGKSRALNRALKHARGEILVFTDDDVVPGPDWLAAFHRASLDYPSANVFGGRILVYNDRVPRWIMKSSNLKTILVSEQDLGDSFYWFPRDQYPVGPNLAVRRRAVCQGSFGWPVNLGPGTSLPLGDELAFLMQFSPRDARDRLYVPDSVVKHHIGGRQLSTGNALLRCFLGGYAAGLLGRGRSGPRTNEDDSLWRVARLRLCGLSSCQEFFCVLARGLGVLAGTASPFARVLYS